MSEAVLSWLCFLATSPTPTPEQTKIETALVANTLIFYNVFELTRILHDLNQQGYEFEPEAIAELSPYLTQHVNRFGSIQRPKLLIFDHAPPGIKTEKFWLL